MTTNSTHELCPKCQAQDIYHDGSLWICPLCAHEWVEFPKADASAPQDTAEPDAVVRDANGAPLADGDTVVVIKDLPVKGASGPIKGGTKVKGIRISLSVPGHNIACKIDGFGQMHLKSEFVRKA